MAVGAGGVGGGQVGGGTGGKLDERFVFQAPPGVRGGREVSPAPQLVGKLPSSSSGLLDGPWK